MDIARQLKQGINTGNIVFGQRQTSSECSKGEAKMVLVAANCPENFIDELIFVESTNKAKSMKKLLTNKSESAIFKTLMTF